MPSRQMVFQIEIISLSLYYAFDMGGLFYVGPAYESALLDVKRLYPSLNLSQNIVTDLRFFGCADWMDVSDNVIAEYYYRHDDKWRRANLTVFLNTVADCDGHGAAMLATSLQKLIISSSPAVDIVKWPTRIETGAGGKTAMLSATKLFAGLLQYFQWSTVTIVCDAYRNPLFDTMAQIMRKSMSVLLQSNISLIKVDGFSPQTDYYSILNDLNRQTRVILYIVFGSTLRKFLIAARSLNMTRGDHVHLCFRVTRNPLVGNFHWRYADEYDEVAKEAYKSVFIAESNPEYDVPPPGTEAHRLRKEWRDASFQHYNFSYSATDTNIHLFPAYAMPVMVAQVVNEFLEANQTEMLEDGRHVALKFHDRTFNLRIGNFSFDQYGSIAGVDGIVGQYDEAGNLTTVVRALVPLQIIQVKPISWAGAVWPVPNRPLCGYDGKDPACWPKHNNDTEVAIAVTVVVLSILFLVAALKARDSLRKGAERQWWEIPQEEVLRQGIPRRRRTVCDIDPGSMREKQRKAQVTLTPDS